MNGFRTVLSTLQSILLALQGAVRGNAAVTLLVHKINLIMGTQGTRQVNASSTGVVATLDTTTTFLTNRALDLVPSLIHHLNIYDVLLLGRNQRIVVDSQNFNLIIRQP